MSRKTTKNDPIYVMRTVRLPLSGSEMESRKSELPLVISQEGRLAEHRKSVMSELKAEAEELADKRDKLVTEINAGERVEDLRCLKAPSLTERTWNIMHPTTGEVLEQVPMTWAEAQGLREAEAEATASTQAELPLDEDDTSEGSNLRHPEPPGDGGMRLLALPPMPIVVPPVGADLPALEAVASGDDSVIEGEVVEGRSSERHGAQRTCAEAPGSNLRVEGEAIEDITQYLKPLVLNEAPRMSATGGGVSSICMTLEKMLADVEEVKKDSDRYPGHYDFLVAAIRAGLGFMCVRQWTGQKSTWSLAVGLAQTITGQHVIDFPKALDLLPAFAAHMKHTATLKNPKNGLKSWNPKADAAELDKAVEMGNEAITALFAPTDKVAPQGEKPDKITYSLAYAFWSLGQWNQGGILTPEKRKTKIPALGTLSEARHFAHMESAAQPTLLIHVCIVEDKSGFHSERGDLWYFDGQEVPGGVICGLPRTESLKQLGAWDVFKGNAALFAEGDIAPALSTSQQAERFVKQLVGGGA